MGMDTRSQCAAALDLICRPGHLTLGIELPLDFDPDEAEEIAEELMAAAERARAMSADEPKKPGKKR